MLGIFLMHPQLFIVFAMDKTFFFFFFLQDLGKVHKQAQHEFTEININQCLNISISLFVQRGQKVNFLTR